MFLAGLRISLVLLALFMLSEAVLSVDRTGLPYFVVMVDDSASQQVVDQYADPKAKATAADLAKVAGHPEADRLALAQGLLDEGRRRDPPRAAEEAPGPALPRLERRPARSPRSTSPRTSPRPSRSSRRSRPAGDQSRLGAGVRQVLTELRGRPADGDRPPDRRPDDRRRDRRQGRRVRRQEGRPALPDRPGRPRGPSRHRALRAAGRRRRLRRRPRPVPAQADARRGSPSRSCTVRLKQTAPTSADPNATKDLETIKVIAPPDGQPMRLEIGHRPRETGQITYIVEVESKPRELQAENNRIEKTITVREEKLKVLYVDSEPRYEFRYLKTFLDREQTIDLNVVLQSSDPQYSNQDRGGLADLPVVEGRPVRLRRGDPRRRRARLPQQLADGPTSPSSSPRRGAASCSSPGENYDPLRYRGTPLETLLPIELAEARNPIAVAGRDHRVPAGPDRRGAVQPDLPVRRRRGDQLRRSGPACPSCNGTSRPPARSRPRVVLAEHPTITGVDGPLPLMLYQIVGSGKTMFHAVDDTWRWRFRVGDRYFGRFWTQTIRFLARSKILGQKKAEIQTERQALPPHRSRSRSRSASPTRPTPRPRAR